MKREKTNRKKNLAVAILSSALTAALAVILVFGTIVVSDYYFDPKADDVYAESKGAKSFGGSVISPDDHASALVQIYNNGSLPAYDPNAGGSQGSSGTKEIDHVDQDIDLSKSSGFIQGSVNSNYCSRYDTMQFRVTNTGNKSIAFIFYEDVKGVDDYIWNGKEWRDDFYDDFTEVKIEPGAHYEITLNPSKSQQFVHWPVRGCYVKLWALQPTPGPQHVEIKDGDITTTFDIDANGLQFQAEEKSVSMTLSMVGDYEPTAANLMDAMQSNGYDPPLYMKSEEVPEDFPVLTVFDYFPQKGDFEVTITNNY